MSENLERSEPREVVPRIIAHQTIVITAEDVAKRIANQTVGQNLQFVPLRVIIDGVEKEFTIDEFKSKLGF